MKHPVLQRLERDGHYTRQYLQDIQQYIDEAASPAAKKLAGEILEQFFLELWEFKKEYNTGYFDYLEDCNKTNPYPPSGHERETTNQDRRHYFWGRGWDDAEIEEENS